MDNTDRHRQLDKTVARIFMGSTSALLGTLMCQFEIMFSEDVPTAAVGNKVILWNPEFFDRCTPDGRAFVLAHELWHPARLHGLRRGTRDPELWNVAADYVINEWLEKNGYKCGPDDLGGLKICINKKYFGMVEEAIYELLDEGDIEVEGPMFRDITENDDEDAANIPAVVAAFAASVEAGENVVTDEMREALSEYLNPVVPWQTMLGRFFTELARNRYTWQRPSRRHIARGLYLPSGYKDDGKLANLNYYLDVSGSVTNPQILRFQSEFVHVRDTYRPEMMTQIQFNADIVKIDEIHPCADFVQPEVIAGGGTDLAPVRQHIIDTRPTAAIIMTDLGCAAMEPLPFDIPIIWILSNTKARPPFGEYTYVD